MTFVVSAVVALGLLPAPGNLYAERVPREVLIAAGDGLSRFLNAIPPGELEHFGFGNHEELSRADVGEPFRVYTMDPQEILGFAKGEPVEVGIHPTEVWQFPVVAEGTSRTLLTVARMPDGWEAVDLGGLSPAIEMEELADRWPASEGHELMYVRVYQTGSQFIAVEKDGDTHLVPVESTARSLGMLEESDLFEYRLLAVSETVSILAPFVRGALLRMQD
jgi:hypothetical protein